MELVKIEELVNDGRVLYHTFITKTEKEKRELQERKEVELKLKELRRLQQELNVQRNFDLKRVEQDKGLR